MNIRDVFINHALLSFGDLVSKQQVINYLEFYQECQWWTRDHLIDFQNTKLRELIGISIKEVAFYTELYHNNGIKRGEILTRDDLPKLPSISKSDLKKNYPHMCTRKTNWPVKEFFTSGSSGNPFAVRVDNLTMSQARALMILRALYAGWKVGEPVFQTGMTLERGLVKKLKDFLFNVYYASAYDLSDKKLDTYLQVIDTKKIKFIMGYPGSVLALADRAGRVGFNQKMEGIATWGDNLYAHYRKKIEQKFGCRVTDTYGCGEGIQVAAQCPDGHGHYHLFMPHVIVEIVDGNDQPVKRGESGNILLTRLEPGAMPLIRYKVGDVGRMPEEIHCPCGRGFEILASIDGRDSDFIYTPNGNKLIVHFFTGIFEYYTEIDDFMVIQERIDCIRILLVINAKFNETVIERLKKQISEKGDKDLDIEFEIVNTLEYPKTGKRKFVMSKISHAK
jgi:phenylacetate-CoA ligase